ncbi:hypothetical protein IH779_00010 [Patescibacteria group bacterium]|nr:hypothetical protein [Patescibacteria group bacterium]
MSELTQKKCRPCEGYEKAMDASQIANYTSQVADWEVVENRKIKKDFKFKDRREVRQDEWFSIMSQEWKPDQKKILQMFILGGNKAISDRRISGFLTKGSNLGRGYSTTIIGSINYVLKNSKLPYRIEGTEWRRNSQSSSKYKMYARDEANQ